MTKKYSEQLMVLLSDIEDEIADLQEVSEFSAGPIADQIDWFLDEMGVSIVKMEEIRRRLRGIEMDED